MNGQGRGGRGIGDKRSREWGDGANAKRQWPVGHSICKMSRNFCKKKGSGTEKRPMNLSILCALLAIYCISTLKIVPFLLKRRNIHFAYFPVPQPSPSPPLSIFFSPKTHLFKEGRRFHSIVKGRGRKAAKTKNGEFIAFYGKGKKHRQRESSDPLLWF